MNCQECDPISILVWHTQVIRVVDQSHCTYSMGSIEPFSPENFDGQSQELYPNWGIDDSTTADGCLLVHLQGRDLTLLRGAFERASALDTHKDAVEAHVLESLDFMLMHF